MHRTTRRSRCLHSHATRASAAARIPVRTTRRTRSRWRRSSTLVCPSSRLPTSSRRRSPRSTAHRRAISRTWSRPTRTRARSPNGASLPPDEHHDRDHRPRRSDPPSRGRALLRRAGGRDEPAALLPRLSAGDREAAAQGDRVRDRGDPARRLREDPWDAPAGALGSRRAVRAGRRGATAGVSEGRARPPRARGRRSRRCALVAARTRGAGRRRNADPLRRARGATRAERAEGRARQRRLLAAANIEADRGHLRRPRDEHPRRAAAACDRLHGRRTGRSGALGQARRGGKARRTDGPARGRYGRRGRQRSDAGFRRWLPRDPRERREGDHGRRPAGRPACATRAGEADADRGPLRARLQPELERESHELAGGIQQERRRQLGGDEGDGHVPAAPVHRLGTEGRLQHRRNRRLLEPGRRDQLRALPPDPRPDQPLARTAEPAALAAARRRPHPVLDHRGPPRPRRRTRGLRTRLGGRDRPVPDPHVHRPFERHRPPRWGLDSARMASERQISVGGVPVGGGAPVVVQSMTLTKTHDVEATTAQIAALASAGCEVVRCAVPKTEDAEALARIVRFSPIPVIADIHFNASLALKAIDAGVAAVRINPGNIGGPDKVAEVVRAAQHAGIPMRIGANSGSLPKHLSQLAQRDQADALVEAALEEVRLLESLGFYDFKISVKPSHVPTMIRAYRMLSAKVPYPLHLGVTEAGTPFSGSIKSAVGMGALLVDGIGDTLRVSLTADPVEEIRTAFEILKALGLREKGPIMIACPSCGRDNVGVEKLAVKVEERLRDYPQHFEVAVLGCAVNGPGEAGDADFGIAGGRDVGFVYAHGRVLKKVSSDILIDELFHEIDKWIAEGMRRPKRLKMAKPAALAMAEASLIPLSE